MERWLRATRMALIGLVFPALVASCGGGGGGTIHLFFGTNGRGSCERVVVDIDLGEADAVLETTGGSPDCSLAELLDTAGCEATFEERDDGDTLRVTIEDCTVPPVSALFACGFSTADLSEIGEVVEADCECATSGCDETPPVCVSGGDDDPRSCEDCDNDVDDDLNGLEDCEDANCEHSGACGPSTTTTTTTIPDTTTTTFTTTTTLLPYRCDITFRLSDDVTLGALEWVTTFQQLQGSFIGSGAGVECESLTEETLSAFNETGSTLESGLVTLATIDGPADVAHCLWANNGTSAPEPGDFEISDVEAATVDLVVLPDPDIDVEVECDPIGDTTTTTTVTTTSTTVPVEAVTIRVHLDSAGAPLGALQVRIGYGTTGGEFVGEGSAVECGNLLQGALFAKNDNDAAKEVSLGFVALDPFTAPRDIADCSFQTNVEPEIGDFVVTIVDASDANGEPTTASVSLTAITEPEGLAAREP